MDDKSTADQLAAVIERFESEEDRRTVRFVVDIAKQFGATGLPRAKDAASPKEYWLEFSSAYSLNIVPSWGGSAGDHLAIYCPRGEKLSELRSRVALHLGVEADQLEAWNTNSERTDSQNIHMSALRSKAALGAIVAVIGWLAQEAERTA